MSDLLKVKIGGSSYLCKWESKTIPVSNVRFLLNGRDDTDQPVEGTISQYSTDDTFPIKGLPVIKNEFISTSGVYFQNSFIKTALGGTTDFTLDFWFFGEYHNGQYTPHFIGFTRMGEADYMLKTDYYTDVNSFYWEYFTEYSLQRFSLTKGEWHHLCFEQKCGTSSNETFIFVDGHQVSHLTNRIQFESNYYFRFGENYPKTIYRFGQICIREGIVWNSDFTPPTKRYVPAP